MLDFHSKELLRFAVFFREDSSGADALAHEAVDYQQDICTSHTCNNHLFEEYLSTHDYRSNLRLKASFEGPRKDDEAAMFKIGWKELVLARVTE